MAKIKKCKNCGAEFKSSKDRRLYCCADCNGRVRKKKIYIKTNFDSIAEINKKALEMGMSYGSYVAKFGG